MKYSLIILAFFLSSQVGFGQTLDFKLFESTKGEKLSEVDKNLGEYRRLKKKNKAYLKGQRKKYKSYRDQTKSSARDSANIHLPDDSLKILQDLQKEYFLYTDEWYSLEELQNWD